MAYPNLGNLTIAAAMASSAATPPVVTKNVNVLGETRTAEGIFVVNLNEPIDFTQRFAIPYVNSAAWGTCQLNAAVQTDLTVGILVFDTVGGIVAGDQPHELVVFRGIIL